jgi:hypothetical protein
MHRRAVEILKAGQSGVKSISPLQAVNGACRTSARRFFIARCHAKMIVRDALGFRHAAFDDKTAVLRYFLAPARQ